MEKFDLLLHTVTCVALTNDLCGTGIKQFAARNTKMENEDRPRVSKTNWKVAVLYCSGLVVESKSKSVCVGC